MGLSTFGVLGFRQSGPARWHPSGWDLDRLIVPYDGYKDNLDTFVAGLSMWSASSLNGNMFLADYSIDSDKRWPSVDLIYHGKRNGQATPNQNHTGSNPASARYHADSGATATLDVDIQYLAPVGTTRKIERTRATGGGAQFSFDTTNIIVLWWNARFKNWSNPPQTNSEALSLFGRNTVSYTNSAELVPGQYYQNEYITMTLLESLGS